MAEIIVGEGKDADSDSREGSHEESRERHRNDDSHGSSSSKIKVYGADGTLTYSITPYDDVQGGVNVSVGELGL